MVGTAWLIKWSVATRGTKHRKTEKKGSHLAVTGSRDEAARVRKGGIRNGTTQ